MVTLDFHVNVLAEGTRRISKIVIFGLSPCLCVNEKIEYLKFGLFPLVSSIDFHGTWLSPPHGNSNFF